MSQLSRAEIDQILNRKERWVTLTTIGPDGYPHSVPIGYFLKDDLIAMGCRDGTQKVKNIERDPRVSVLWENGRGKDTLTGILFQGDAHIARTAEERWEFKREACKQRGEDPPEKLSDGAVYIVIKPTKTISWNRPLRKDRKN